MAYKLNKAKRLTEEIELEGGEIIKIDVNVGKISLAFNAKYNEVLKLKNIKGDPTPQDLEDLGKAVIDMVALVVGDEGTTRILEYYENNYIEMLDNILPFIVDVVVPTMAEFLKEKQADAANKYKSKQRRKFNVK